MSDWTEVTLENGIRFLPLLVIGILFLTRKGATLVAPSYQNQQQLLKIIGYHLIVLSVTLFLLLEAYAYFRIFFDQRSVLFVLLVPLVVIALLISFHLYTKRLQVQDKQKK